MPALEASAFHFMGSADAVTLHVQFWFFACGFAAAVAGLLAPRVSPYALWPCLVLVLVTPRVVGRNLDPQADFLLDYFFALAALLVALWLVEREPWLLATASVFLAAAAMTKREGQLLVACIVVAGAVASWRQWRYAWPRLALVAGVAVAALVPWRIWFSSRDLTESSPRRAALALFHNLDRGWPAFQSAVTTLFDYDLWLVVVPLVGVGVILAFLAGARDHFRRMRSRSTRRARGPRMGAVVVHGARVAVRAGRGSESDRPALGVSRRCIRGDPSAPARRRLARQPPGGGGVVRRALPWLVVALVVLAYPVATLAGGEPAFPTRDECVEPATTDGDIDAVFGYFDSESEAASVRDRAVEVGFTGTEMEWNACGRLRVAVGGIPTLAVGREFVEEATGVGFDVTLEQAAG